MGVVFYLMDRLRQLMGTCWDYCVIWKLNEDPWLLECVDCCCGGTYQTGLSNDDELVFPVTSASLPCKDAMFQHSRMRSCELLSQLPPSLPLDGINAEILITNQPRWLKISKISELSTTTDEIIETKVLIPVPGGLVEFYASKMVPEDQSLIDFVISQCSAISEQEAMTNQLNPNTSLLNHTDFPPYSPSTALASLNLSCGDATADRIRICNSAMNFLQQFSYLTETRSNKDDLLLEGGDDQPDRPFQSDHTQQQFVGLEGSTENNDNPLGNNTNDHPFHHHQQNEEQDKGPLKHEMVRPDSGSDSEPIDDEDDSKYTRRKNGKGNQSKNLVAERKRRKKLNERLYMLRSLVPKISKLDRAAILGDAIEYVMELQKQEKDLQTELEQNSDNEDVGSCSLISNSSQRQNNNIPMEYSNLMGANKFVAVDNYEHEDPSNGFYVGSSSRCPGENNLKRSHDDRSTFDKGHQMEVQVEVAHLEGNEFFIKVFGEKRQGGFVRLMEALDSLGLEITTVNVTSCISLISYVFTVEKKDSEIVQAEYLRESLLQMTRNQSGEWAEMAKEQQGHNHLEPYQQQYFHHPHNQHFHQFQ